MARPNSFCLPVRISRSRPTGGDASTPAVCVRTPDVPRGGGLAAHLARQLDRWATGNAQPSPGLHRR